MAPPNKRNSFMNFVNQWRRNHPQMSTPQAVSECSGIWENMTAQERKPYDVGYKKLPPPLAAADKAHRELVEREQYMRSTTERIVMEGKKSQDIENIKFLFCAFNYFTKDPDNDVHVPAEFAACEYSLREGIISVFSTLIDPGKLNLGLSRDALEHSMTTHNLPLPPRALGESNLVKLHAQMVRYLSKYHGRRPAIVFTTTEMRPIVQSCFRFLACYGHEDFLPKILVFDIQYLFLVLKKEILDMVGLPNDKINIHITNGFFLKDFFEFTKDIACDFHEENDRTKYCVQSMVMRWAFTFSDYMCGDLDITIVPGKHVPSTVKINYRSVTLAGGSSVDSFHSLPSFQGLRIGETNKSRRLRNDNSAISSGFSTADDFEEEDEDKPRERTNSPISSRFSISCAPYVATRKDSPRRSPKELLDDISSIHSLRSSEGFAFQKYSSNATKSDLEEDNEYDRKGRHRLEEISEASESLSTQKRSSKVKEYSRKDGHYHNPSVNLQRCFSKEFLDDNSPNNSRRSSEKYESQGDYRSSQRRSSKELPGNISPFNNFRSNAYISCESTDQNDNEYERQDGRRKEEFWDDISSNNSRRSNAFVPFGGMTQKQPSKTKEPRSLKEFLDNISPINSRRSSESKTKEYPLQRGSSKELPGNITPINNYRSSAYISYGQNGSDEEEEYEREKARRLKEFWDENSSVNSRHSSAFSPFQAINQNPFANIEKYPKRAEPKREEPVYQRRFVSKLPDQPFDFDFDD